MKKFLISITLLVSSMGCFAQLDENTFFVTPKIGANVSCTHSRVGGFQYDNWKPDFMFGVGLGYQFDDRWAATADVLYCEQGVRDKNTGPLPLRDQKGELVLMDFEDITTSFNYVNVPLMANYYIAKGLAIKAGVQFGFLIHACDKYTLNVVDQTTRSNEKTHTEFTSNCNKFDIAIPIGISYDLENNFQLDIRYNYGLTKNIKSEFESWYGNCKNQSVTLTLGYVFEL